MKTQTQMKTEKLEKRYGTDFVNSAKQLLKKHSASFTYELLTETTRHLFFVENTEAPDYAKMF